MYIKNIKSLITKYHVFELYACFFYIVYLCLLLNMCNQVYIKCEIKFKLIQKLIAIFTFQ